MSKRLTARPQSKGTAIASAAGGLIMSTPVTNRPARILARLGGTSGACCGARGGAAGGSNSVVMASRLSGKVRKVVSDQPRGPGGSPGAGRGPHGSLSIRHRTHRFARGHLRAPCRRTSRGLQRQREGVERMQRGEAAAEERAGELDVAGVVDRQRTGGDD